MMTTVVAMIELAEEGWRFREAWLPSISSSLYMHWVLGALCTFLHSTYIYLPPYLGFLHSSKIAVFTLLNLSIELYCTVLHSIAQYCTVLHTPLNCIVEYFPFSTFFALGTSLSTPLPPSAFLPLCHILLCVICLFTSSPPLYASMLSQMRLQCSLQCVYKLKCTEM